MRLKSYIQILLMGFLLYSCSGQEISKGDVDGIWFLKEIEGEEAAYVFGGGLPTVNFDWEQQKVYGTGGCNRYSVNYKLDQDKIKFDSLSSMDVLCEDTATEERFLRLLSESENMKIEENALVFMKGKKVLLRFLRLDLSAMAGDK